MTRRPLIAGNWKMNLGPAAGAALAHSLRAELADVPVEVAVFPAALTIPAVLQALKHSDIGVGVQHFHAAANGAFTGELSLAMVEEVGCSWGLVGHSERRKLFGLTDTEVNERTRTALRTSKVRPMVCLGESLAERDADRTREVVGGQLKAALSGLTQNEMLAVTLAYEPVWAIGTGRTASPRQAQEVHAHLRRLLEELGGPGVARAVRILYGGSVKPANVDQLMAQPDVDGALVGGAALKAESFGRIVRFQSS